MIDLNDLRHSINRALRLGRYQIVVKAQGGEPVPASITLDLLERDDDLFDTDEPSRRQYGATITPEGDALVDTVTDDHGPAIPEQGETHIEIQRTPAGGTKVIEEAVRIYEFALQDAIGLGDLGDLRPKTLADASIMHSPDFCAAQRADWVHVYDRVTRERRTLKRPEPDAVLTGLRDVAADLRRGSRVRHAGPASNGDTGSVLHVEGGWAMTQFDRSDRPGLSPVGHLEIAETYAENPSDPMPPVGPLTSTEGLKAGDVLRVVKENDIDLPVGFLTRFIEHDREGFKDFLHCNDNKGDERSIWAPYFAFVARPGVWMPWEGGENPVPGTRVKIRYDNNPESGPHASESIIWARPWHEKLSESLNVAAYMVVDPSPVSSDT